MSEDLTGVWKKAGPLDIYYLSKVVHCNYGSVCALPQDYFAMRYLVDLVVPDTWRSSHHLI